jgi:hypothetical protein
MRRRLYSVHSELNYELGIKLLRAAGKDKLLMSINDSSQAANPDFLILVL